MSTPLNHQKTRTRRLGHTGGVAVVIFALIALFQLAKIGHRHFTADPSKSVRSFQMSRGEVEGDLALWLVDECPIVPVEVAGPLHAIALARHAERYRMLREGVRPATQHSQVHPLTTEVLMIPLHDTSFTVRVSSPDGKTILATTVYPSRAKAARAISASKAQLITKDTEKRQYNVVPRT
jgi:hypothetical protein